MTITAEYKGNYVMILYITNIKINIKKNKHVINKYLKRSHN